MKPEERSRAAARVSELVERFEAQDFRTEGQNVATLLQGIFAGTATKWIGDPFESPIHVDSVEIPQDLDTGLYENHFTVVTAAGHRIRVTVELE